MIIENHEEKKELDKIPNVDENGDPIYKIDKDEKSGHVGEAAEMEDESEFKDTLQDLKETTSQD